MYVDIYTSLSLHFNNLDAWLSGKVRCKDLLDPGSIPNSNIWCFGKSLFFCSHVVWPIRFLVSTLFGMAKLHANKC